MERDEWLRAAWRVIVAGKDDPERLVFVDEMGANTSLCPLYAWAPRGERAHARVPRNRAKYTTLSANMDVEGVGHCLAVEGSTTAAVFETCVEWVLAQSLRSGQLVVMDNLSTHKGQRIKELIEGRGCELLYLRRPYSADLNPIEEAFSKIKWLLREAEARTSKTPIEAMGAAISAVPDREARGFLEHCGYHMLV
jgi:transposase